MSSKVAEDGNENRRATPTRPKYALDQLIGQCDFDAPYSAEEREWLYAEPMGRELR